MRCTSMYIVSFENSFQKTQNYQAIFQSDDFFSYLFSKKSLEVLNGLSLVQLNLVWAISFHYLLQIDPFHFPSHFEMSYLGLLKALLYTKSQKTLQIFI